MANTTSSLFTVAASTSAALAQDSVKAAAQRELAARRGPQTVVTLEKTFPGLAILLDKVVVNKFINAGIVDGCAYLDADGNPTNDEDAGVESNPAYMTVIASGRTAWVSLDLVNEECFQITNGIWDSRAKTGSLTLLGFNDNSEDAPYRGRKFTVTEAGALATMFFGTRGTDRSTGIFFRNFVVQSIKAAHNAYLQSPAAKAIADEAKARRARQDAARERAMAKAAEEENYRLYQASVPNVGTSVIPEDAGLKIAKDGSLRVGGKFVKKGETIA